MLPVQRKRLATIANALFLLACTTVLSACAPQDEKSTRPSHSAPLAVPVQEIRTRAWQQTIDGFGTLEAADKISLGVETAGTVSAVYLREGLRVEAGQVLLTLDDRKQRLRLKRARAEVESARAELNRTRSTFNRYQQLSTRQAIAEETVQQAEAAYRAATARINQTIAAHDLARQELTDLTLVSPASGVVESDSVEPGQRVRPGETLAVLQSDQPLQAVTYVREEEVNLLAVGDSAPVRSPGAPGQLYQGRIESIARAADATTGNFAVKLRIEDDDGHLRAGMSARVSLKSAPLQGVMAIPRSALIDRQRRRVAFIVKGGLAHRVEPVLGLGNDEFVTVRSGLSSGDQLIVGHLRLIVDQTRVRAVSDAHFALASTDR